MKFTDFLFKALQSNSGVSSKRLAGFLGWIFCMVAIGYLCVKGSEAPTILEMFMFCSTSLLGLDSVLSVFDKFKTNKNCRINEKEENNLENH